MPSHGEAAQQALALRDAGRPDTPEFKMTRNEIWDDAYERPLVKKDISSLLARLPWLANSPLKQKAEAMDGTDGGAAKSEAGHMLRLAAVSGDADGVRDALAAGADPNDADVLEGNTALYEAARKGYHEVVRVLMDEAEEICGMTADPEQINLLGLLPMQEAVRMGHAGVVRELMRAGVKTQDVAHGGKSSMDALIEAANWGHSGTVEALLEDPFQNPDVENTLGETPVMMAARAGHAEVVRALAHGNANVNHRASNGSTALMIAANENRYDVVRYLIAHRAQVNDADEHGATALLYASRRSKCSCKHNKVKFLDRGPIGAQLSGFNKCTCSRQAHTRSPPQLDFQGQVSDRLLVLAQSHLQAPPRRCQIRSRHDLHRVGSISGHCSETAAARSRARIGTGAPPELPGC